MSIDRRVFLDFLEEMILKRTCIYTHKNKRSYFIVLTMMLHNNQINHLGDYVLSKQNKNSYKLTGKLHRYCRFSNYSTAFLNECQNSTLNIVPNQYCNTFFWRFDNQNEIARPTSSTYMLCSSCPSSNCHPANLNMSKYYFAKALILFRIFNVNSKPVISMDC